MGQKHDRNLLDEVVDTVENAARSVVGTFGKALRTPISLVGTLLPKHVAPHRRKVGAPPGIEQHPEIDKPPQPDEVIITCIDYGPEKCESKRVTVADLGAFFAGQRPDWAAVRWINVDGLNPYVINQLKQQYELHTLAAEDVLNTPQRPKLEAYGDDLFIVARMVMHRGEHLHTEQTSFFLLDRLLLTFQETAGDVWQGVRERLDSPQLKLRQSGADYLLYALLDAIVDHGFPLLESYSDELEQLEDPIMRNPRPEQLQRTHHIKRELAILRRVLWPMREVIDELYRGELDRITEPTRLFMRDVYDHTVQVLDIIETYREMATGLSDLYINAVSQRMNEVMKVLTIMATLFIPISFIAGLWGMNVDVPMQKNPVGFWYVLAGCGVAVVGLLIYFKRKRWL
jgi:magnesium transporter